MHKHHPSRNPKKLAHIHTDTRSDPKTFGASFSIVRDKWQPERFKGRIYCNILTDNKWESWKPQFL